MRRFFLIAASVLTVFLLFTCAGHSVLTDSAFSLTDALPFGAGYGQGTILDSAEYDAASLRQSGVRGPSRRTEVVLPKSFSLKDYAPIPGNQGDIGSCFAWASAYAAQTILESQYLHRTDKLLSTRMAFSPLNIYGIIEQLSGLSIKDKGASLMDTVQIMASMGSPRQSEFDEKYVSNEIKWEKYEEILRFPVMGFTILFTSRAEANIRVNEVKMSIYDGYPVIIGMKAPPSFKLAKDIWMPESGETPDAKIGHALCVVGYDDEKYGGAFEVMNSWGEEWGNGGYTWIDYKTFGKWIEQAWTLREDSWLYNTALEYTARVSFNGEGKTGELPVRLLEDGIYRLRSALKNGTRLHIDFTDKEASNEAGVYLYVLTADALYGKITNAGGDEWISGDKTAKAENVIFLFSRKQLDLDSIISSIQNSKGAVLSRLKNAIGRDFIPAANCKYEYDTMGFTADLLNEDSVAGMVLLIDYDSQEKYIDNMVSIQGKTGIKTFFIGAAEVTVGEFEDFIKATSYKTAAERTGKGRILNYKLGEIEDREDISWANPGFTQEKSHPVVQVSWYDAIEYCNWRSLQDGLRPAYNVSGSTVKLVKNANGYRLPTEAEWEYACRAGTITPYYTGNTMLPSQANYSQSMIFRSTPVRKYDPNQWGLYDMQGNVLEWCWDPVGNMRAVRSGTWIANLQDIQAGVRKVFPPDLSVCFIGFRLARSADI